MEFEEAMRILAALEREEVDYVLVGAMAMAAQGLVRATRDLDLFVDPAAENVERLRKALQQVFPQDESIREIRAEDLAGDYPAIQYVPPHGLYGIDILSRLGEAFSFEDIEWEERRVGETKIRVATPGMLIRMKRDTVRPQDGIDARALRERFGLKEE
ncbi:MAG: hypothetical protein P1V51_13240 [Deltaproteobacteria bacterium]|nr:hypothetical protein [Deltaproteobacteria bacterium]